MKRVQAVDLFCGAGGASTSLVRAVKELGLELELLAINHWPTAIDTHRLNHPGVHHLCESVERVNPRTTRRERQSFFRRLAEKKGRPRIDFETVLFLRKPLTRRAGA